MTEMNETSFMGSNVTGVCGDAIWDPNGVEIAPHPPHVVSTYWVDGFTTQINGRTEVERFCTGKPGPGIAIEVVRRSRGGGRSCATALVRWSDREETGGGEKTDDQIQ